MSRDVLVDGLHGARNRASINMDLRRVGFPRPQPAPAAAMEATVMSAHLRVLLIEDSEDDAWLLARRLQKDGYDLESRRVETPEGISAALAEHAWDVIIADYSLPLLTAIEALEIVKRSGMDVPFLIVSGTIGEETAVAAMRAGAHDYIMKDNLARLTPAVEREIREARIRYETRLALRHSEEQLRQYNRDLEDLLERRTAKIRELERQRMAIERMAANGRMAARIAHEINNPLAGIKNSFTLVEDAIPADHPFAHYVPRIRREIDRIANIVRQMFDLYRPEQETPREFDVVAAVQDVVDLLQLNCRQNGIVVHSDVPSTPVRVRLPRNSLFQVLFNVIQNAIEASPAGGTVTVALADGNERLEFAVSDQGPGIPSEIGNRVFEPFFTTKESGQGGSGLGLGLSISREMLESLGGTLVYDSTGSGTTFRISIPIPAVSSAP
jgi:signal transduction histidine kinase